MGHPTHLRANPCKDEARSWAFCGKSSASNHSRIGDLPLFSSPGAKGVFVSLSTFSTSATILG